MKFEVGEIVLMVDGSCEGAEAEIIGLSPITTEGNKRDYRVEINGHPNICGNGWCCNKESIRKKKPPEEFDWVKICKLDKIDKREIA